MNNESICNESACTLCGETITLEGHHVAGIANDRALKTPLCKACHAEQNNLLRDHDVNLSHSASRTFLEILMDFLKGVGAFLKELSERCLYHAQQIQSLIHLLDDRLPSWRQLITGITND